MEVDQAKKCPKCQTAMKKKEGVLYAGGKEVYECTKPGCGTTAPAPNGQEER